ncbi:MAG: MBL fold metallo-hydrolase [Kofleriaceae bacterium]
MSSHRLFATALVAAAACGTPATPAAPAAPPAALTIDPYPASESDVNAYVISDGAGAIVIDATRTPSDGAAVAARVRTRTDGPVTVLITHGHPDHFLGLGALRAAFPDARFVVARPEIKDDIIGMATWMTGQGWLAQLPAMQPRTAAHPDGFDYAGQLQVLDQPRLTLPGGAALELATAYPATEAAHMTTAYSADANALFTGDLAYRDVHLWLGVGVTRAAAAAWQATLDQLASTWSPRHPTVYPGHGAPTDTGVFAADRRYIDDILAITAEAATDQAAIDQMIARYPGYANREFLLMMSVTNLRAP